MENLTLSFTLDKPSLDKIAALIASQSMTTTGDTYPLATTKPKKTKAPEPTFDLPNEAIDTDDEAVDLSIDLSYDDTDDVAEVAPKKTTKVTAKSETATATSYSKPQMLEALRTHAKKHGEKETLALMKKVTGTAELGKVNPANYGVLMNALTTTVKGRTSK